MSHTVLGTFSSSSGSGTYDVKIDNSSGKLWCDCRGWKMKREGQPYHCRHTDEIRETLERQGWRFEQRFDENYYVTRRQDTGAIYPSLNQPVSQTQAAKVASAMVKADRVNAPSLEEVRKANKKPGYDVVRRVRRNLGD